MFEGWQVDVGCFSETSHTARASRVIRSSFKRLGFRCALGRPVPDKFRVDNPVGSLRGLSKGVAVVSRFPVFSRETALVSAEVWESCRLLHVTVQAWDIPVHVLVMYLAPNAILGSLKYDSNCRIVAAAALLAERLMGPVLLVGDWNCPADSFEAVRLLGSNYGFADLAALWSERAGSPLEPTCAGATRHSFAFGNTEVQRFLGPVEVRHPFDLDKHAVLVVDVQFPRANPTVLRWLRPQPLADLVPDVERLSCLGGEVLPKLAESVRTSLAAHRPDEALLSWASTVEQVVCDAAEVDGRTRRAFVGRCSTDGPVAMNLAPPRVRFGRPGDVASPLLSLTLQQRRWLRQVRRRKALLKLLEALEVRGMLTGDLARVGALWRAVLASPGFGHSFAGSRLFCPVCRPWVHWLREVGSFLESALQDLCRQFECKKKRMFVADLEENWKNQGGSLPFRLIRDEQPDAITAVTVRTHVLLAAQRWSPLGLEWIKVQSVVGLHVGQVLDGLRRVVVRAVEAPFIQLDARLTRREAASLYLDVSSADPQDWVPHFLSGWNRYWQKG